jgi:hypothetical protein
MITDSKVFDITSSYSSFYENESLQNENIIFNSNTKNLKIENVKDDENSIDNSLILVDNIIKKVNQLSEKFDEEEITDENLNLNEKLNLILNKIDLINKKKVSTTDDKNDIFLELDLAIKNNKIEIDNLNNNINNIIKDKINNILKVSITNNVIESYSYLINKEVLKIKESINYDINLMNVKIKNNNSNYDEIKLSLENNIEELNYKFNKLNEEFNSKLKNVEQNESNIGNKVTNIEQIITDTKQKINDIEQKTKEEQKAKEEEEARKILEEQKAKEEEEAKRILEEQKAKEEEEAKRILSDSLLKLINKKVKKYPSIPYTLYLNLVIDFELNEDFICAIFIKTDDVYELRGKTSKYFLNDNNILISLNINLKSENESFEIVLFNDKKLHYSKNKNYQEIKLIAGGNNLSNNGIEEIFF